MLSTRSNKEDKGKAADLTEDEASFSSKEGGYGCYGESAKEMKADMGNRQKTTAKDIFVGDAIAHFPPLKNHFGVLSYVYSSDKDSVKKNPAFGPGR